MTEERINQITKDCGLGGWYSLEMRVIKCIAAEVRKEGIDEMRDAVLGISAYWKASYVDLTRRVKKVAEWLKEQG